MKKYIILGIVFSALVIGGCGDYLDVNTNPNQAVAATPELVLTTALNVTAGRLGHNATGGFWSGQWAPSGSVSGFTAEKTYDITSTYNTGVWTGVYDNLTDYEYIYSEANKAGKKSIAGIAQVMKAYNYQILVDAYGNVPYREALKGTSKIQPVYNDGLEIYDSLFIVLDKGIANLSLPIDATNASAATSDIYFGGNTAQWIKFAKTLKLRMLIRISGVSARSAFVLAEMNKPGFMGSNTNFLGPGEDVKSTPGYLKTAGKLNPFYETYGYSAANSRAGNHDFYCYNKFFVDMLKGNFDPRIDRLAYTPTGGGGHVGVPFGEGSDVYIYTKVSGFGPAFIPQDGTVTASTLYAAPMVLMTAAESFFLQAEAVQNIPGVVSNLTVQALYEAGITESFKSLGVPSAVASAITYYSQAINNVSFVTSTNKVTAIRTQKWVALANYSGFEAWAEYRRTNTPAVPVSTRALTPLRSPGFSPAHLMYPLSELSSNAVNVATQTGAGYDRNSKIFWMP